MGCLKPPADVQPSRPICSSAIESGLDDTGLPYYCSSKSGDKFSRIVQCISTSTASMTFVVHDRTHVLLLCENGQPFTRLVEYCCGGHVIRALWSAFLRTKRCGVGTGSRNQ